MSLNLSGSLLWRVCVQRGCLHQPFLHRVPTTVLLIRSNYTFPYANISPLLIIKIFLQVFQRNFSNQNLISIIPVDHPSRSGNALLATPPDFHEKVAASNINLRTSSLTLPGIKPLPVEEKPKASSKFSRFDDSDSDESDDYEMTLLKSDSEAEYVEQEEIILEEVEGDENEELIIEVEDYIVLEEANGTD